MTLIRITRGGCGISYRDAAGTLRHTCKTPESGPFECDEDQAARLVSLGVAKYLDTPGTDNAANAAAEATAAAAETAAGTAEAADASAAVSEMSYNELKKLAAKLGLKPKSQKQADLIAAILEAGSQAENGVDETDGGSTAEDPDALPELSAADPV